MPPKGMAGDEDSMRWWQDDSGSASMMRIGAMIAIILGCMIVLTGLTLSCVEVAYQLKIQSGTLLVGSGTALILSALGFKALQRQAEAKIQ